MPTPASFMGHDDDKVLARAWLSKADDYLQLSFPTYSDADLVRLFGLLLDGSARTWFTLCREEMGEAWTLHEVYAAFQTQFGGESTLALIRSKLDDLTFSLDADFTTFTSQWQDLIAQCYPREWAMARSPDSDRLLGTLFAEKIKAGSVRVWKEAYRSLPEGLQKWRIAVQHAIALLKVLDAAKDPNRHRSTNRARVNAIEHESDGEGDTREEGEPAEVNKMQGKGQKGGSTASAKSPAMLYSPEEFELLKKKGLCAYCAKKGHMLKECPDKLAKKQKTKATPAQLNA